MKLIKKLIRFVIILLIIFIAAVVVMGKIKYENAIEEKPIESAVAEIKSKEHYTKLEDLTKTYKAAVISVEDRRFYMHRGVDPIGILRAIYRNIKIHKLSEGGSSITQQLAKNMYFITDDTPTRKVAELLVTYDLEKKYSKDEILELYFNTIYFGSGYYCVYDASIGYFGKQPFELSAYEATMLAGIPNAPSVYSPHKNPDLAKKRQEKVLDAMVKNKVITKEEAKIISEQ